MGLGSAMHLGIHLHPRCHLHSSTRACKCQAPQMRWTPPAGGVITRTARWASLGPEKRWGGLCTGGGVSQAGEPELGSLQELGFPEHFWTGNDGLSLTPTPELWTCAQRLGHGLVGHRHGEGVAARELHCLHLWLLGWGGEGGSPPPLPGLTLPGFPWLGDHSCFR